MPKVKAKMVAGRSIESLLAQLPATFRDYAEAIYKVMDTSGDSAAILMVVHKDHIQVSTAAMINPDEAMDDRVTSTMLVAEVARKMQGVFAETIRELAAANEEESGH